MASRTVRVGASYVYRPVGMDAWERNPYRPEPGSICEVVNVPGAPRANTMGHCYIEGEDVNGEEFGPVLVLTNSLIPLRDCVKVVR